MSMSYGLPVLKIGYLWITLHLSFIVIGQPYTEQFADIGTSVTLRCYTKYTEPVNWYMTPPGGKETEVCLSGELINGFTKLCSLDKSQPGAYHLVIHSVQQILRGMYRCAEKEGMSLKRSAWILLTVRGAYSTTDAAAADAYDETSRGLNVTAIPGNRLIVMVIVFPISVAVVLGAIVSVIIFRKHWIKRHNHVVKKHRTELPVTPPLLYTETDKGAVNSGNEILTANQGSFVAKPQKTQVNAGSDP